jgi:hypothetical protein
VMLKQLLDEIQAQVRLKATKRKTADSQANASVTDQQFVEAEAKVAITTESLSSTDVDSALLTNHVIESSKAFEEFDSINSIMSNEISLLALELENLELIRSKLLESMTIQIQPVKTYGNSKCTLKYLEETFISVLHSEEKESRVSDGSDGDDNKQVVMETSGDNSSPDLLLTESDNSTTAESKSDQVENSSIKKHDSQKLLSNSSTKSSKSQIKQ